MGEGNNSTGIIQLACSIINKPGVNVKLSKGETVLLEMDTNENEKTIISLEDLLRTIKSDLEEVF
ncbi:MAG: hypothetical protein N2491_13885, partial [Negativicutes bacterium]|nr:hypothetical protein [Negativicutes bacterium]